GLQFAIKRQDLLACGHHAVPLQDGTQGAEQSGFPINQRAVTIEADALIAGEIEHASILWKRRKKMGEQRLPFPVSSNHVSEHGFSRAEKHSIEERATEPGTEAWAQGARRSTTFSSQPAAAV